MIISIYQYHENYCKWILWYLYNNDTHEGVKNLKLTLANNVIHIVFIHVLLVKSIFHLMLNRKRFKIKNLIGKCLLFWF